MTSTNSTKRQPTKSEDWVEFKNMEDNGWSLYNEATGSIKPTDLVLKNGVALAQYLSQNKTKHVYMETNEEHVVMVIQYIAMLDLKSCNTRLQELLASGIRKKANKLVALLNSSPVFDTVEQLVQHSAHFMEMPEMNMPWLHCTAPLTMKSVDELIQKGVERSKLCRDNFTSTYESLAAAMQNQDTNNIRMLLQVTDILDIIDSTWEAEMTNQAVNTFGCVGEEDYMSAYDQYIYITSVCNAIKEYVQKDDVWENISKDLHPLLDGFTCTFKFISLNHLDLSYGLPVLTQSPLRALGHHLE
ncbi:hypothetical protein PAXRUDRAFT_807283 [Paxillus rubicundulus Ve08.2h10]|uniref:Uncharacterized protein n=1 Tax=Paxillus rubicundulus Ve08.2h10 TaxID=930991 RepID=A0A0D0CFX5_9AGAM|nr:hypothetical protein PAXRUDRAFT_807283 [Paxillus rubicundulus Ve08.2h10]